MRLQVLRSTHQNRRRCRGPWHSQSPAKPRLPHMQQRAQIHQRRLARNTTRKQSIWRDRGARSRRSDDRRLEKKRIPILAICFHSLGRSGKQGVLDRVGQGLVIDCMAHSFADTARNRSRASGKASAIASPLGQNITSASARARVLPVVASIGIARFGNNFQRRWVGTLAHLDLPVRFRGDGQNRCVLQIVRRLCGISTGDTITVAACPTLQPH